MPSRYDSISLTVSSTALLVNFLARREGLFDTLVCKTAPENAGTPVLNAAPATTVFLMNLRLVAMNINFLM